MISVIIPSFNPEDYIFECIDSLKIQNLSKNRFEILIILNGTKEPYFSSLKKYIKENEIKNIKLFYINSKGVSDARNFGIEKSIGNLICFIDDDDIVSKNYLLELLKICPKDGIGVSNLLNFNNSIKDTTFDYIGKNFKKRDKKKSLFSNRKFLSAIGGKIIPRNVINRTRFNPIIKSGEDSLFMAEISNSIKRIKFTNESVVYYRRVRINSASRKKIDKMKLFVLLKKYIVLLMKEGYEKKFIVSRFLATLIKVIK